MPWKECCGMDERNGVSRELRAWIYHSAKNTPPCIPAMCLLTNTRAGTASAPR